MDTGTPARRSRWTNRSRARAIDAGGGASGVDRTTSLVPFTGRSVCSLAQRAVVRIPNTRNPRQATPSDHVVTTFRPTRAPNGRLARVGVVLDPRNPPHRVRE